MMFTIPLPESCMPLMDQFIKEGIARVDTDPCPLIRAELKEIRPLKPPAGLIYYMKFRYSKRNE